MVAANKIAVALLMLLTTLAFTTNASPVWFEDRLIPENVEEIKRNYISSGLYEERDNNGGENPGRGNFENT